MQGDEKNTSQGELNQSAEIPAEVGVLTERDRLVMAVTAEAVRSVLAFNPIRPDPETVGRAGASHGRLNYPLSSGLTQREAEVLAGIVIGLSNKAIGGFLEISSRTVEVHRTRVIEKIGSNSPLSMVDAAWRLGLLTEGTGAHKVVAEKYGSTFVRTAVQLLEEAKRYAQDE